jgi:quaternary ammonium compound-resistance protein SugE
MTTTSTAWLYLLIAGGFEIAMTTVFRYTDGMTRLVPTVVFFALGFTSFYFLNRSLAGIPLGTAYAVWTGIGAAGTAVIGIAFYAEPVTTLRLVLLTILVGSIMGLKLISVH